MKFDVNGWGKSPFKSPKKVYRDTKEEESWTAWLAEYNKPEALNARRLKLSLRYKILYRKKAVMNSLPRVDGWNFNPRFEEVNLVVRMSFYFRTIVKTCFLHLKEELPNLPQGVLQTILEYADDHILKKNGSVPNGVDTSSTMALYSVLDHKFLNF